jgi:protein subunit release factor B
MASFPVSPERIAALAARMAALGVREDDLDEKFVRSGGPGGQNVNKLSTCVLLVHRPTGTRVKCQTTRSQALNRFLARRLLLEKLERSQSAVADAARARTEKTRRQKRRRSRRAKDQMLADKARRADTKQLRRRVEGD